MNNQTKAMFAGAAGVVAIGASIMAQHTFAASGTKPSSLVAEIATKFNLKQADVQAVVDTHTQEVQTYHQAQTKDALDQAVKDGKLTQAQEDLIIAKQAEVKQQSQTIRDSSATATDKRTQMQKIREDLKTWATTNKIDPQYLRPFGGMGGGHHFRGMESSRTRNPDPIDAPDSADPMPVN
jgi:hypothetical protein